MIRSFRNLGFTVSLSQPLNPAAIQTQESKAAEASDEETNQAGGSDWRSGEHCTQGGQIGAVRRISRPIRHTRCWGRILAGTFPSAWGTKCLPQYLSAPAGQGAHKAEGDGRVKKGRLEGWSFKNLKTLKVGKKVVWRQRLRRLQSVLGFCQKFRTSHRLRSISGPATCPAPWEWVSEQNTTNVIYCRLLSLLH